MAKSRCSALPPHGGKCNRPATHYISYVSRSLGKNIKRQYCGFHLLRMEKWLHSKGTHFVVTRLSDSWTNQYIPEAGKEDTGQKKCDCDMAVLLSKGHLVDGRCGLCGGL